MILFVKIEEEDSSDQSKNILKDSKRFTCLIRTGNSFRVSHIWPILNVQG